MADFDFSTDYRIAAILLFVISLFGVVWNLAIVVFIRLVPSLNNSFGSLTFSLALADFVHQFIFAFYYAPCLFFRDTGMYSWSDQVGFVIMIFYEVCLLSHVAISANRFFAVYTPLTYMKLFSNRNTYVLIASCWIFSVVSLVIKFKTGDCVFYLPQGLWIFNYSGSAFCQGVRMQVSTFDFIKFIVYVFFIVVLDIITIVKLNLLRVAGSISTISTVSSVRSSQANIVATTPSTSGRRSRQMNLAYQAFFQGAFIFLELLTYYILLSYARNKWEAFVLSSVTWGISHAMDGLIVIVCNREFRRQTKKILLCRRS